MAAMPIRFLSTKSGTVHVVGQGNCPVVNKAIKDGSWKGRRSLSPEAALDLTECKKCETHRWAKDVRRASMTPAQKRAETKAIADETRERLAAGQKKQKRAAKREPKRRGPRLPSGESGKAKAEDCLKVAKENGWKTSVEEDGNQITVTAKKDGQTLKIVYLNAKVTFSRVTFSNGNEVKLRNAANWKKQASLPPEERPATQRTVQKSRGTTKRAIKRGDEGAERDEQATLGRPFLMDDPDPVVIEAVAGHKIVWRNGVSQRLDSAEVPGKERNLRLYIHPKSNRRILQFAEVVYDDRKIPGYGAERSVYLDKILRVI